MYKPQKYLKDENSYVRDFITQHPFATFITEDRGLLATHIPVLMSDDQREDFTLFSHIAKHNEQLSHLRDGAPALVIFHGTHGYVSSSWYTHDDISTWDYSAVHINATVKLQTEAELKSSLQVLVHRFEKSQDNPKEFKDLPNSLIDSHVKRITGFYLLPTRIQSIAKYHQGFEKKDIASIENHLKERNDPMDPELINRIRHENRGD